MLKNSSAPANHDKTFQLTADTQQFFLAQLADELAERVATRIVQRLPKPNIILPRYLTVAQAAAYISHTKRSFEYLISKSLFPVVRRERLILIDREDLDTALARFKS